MNRNTIIGIAIAIILVILGIWYYSSNTANMPLSANLNVIDSQTNANGSQGSQTKTTPANPNTFKGIFDQSGNHQCVYDQVNPSNRSNSIIYIADGKMRGEFRTMTAETTSANIMIYTGGYLYSWKEGATVGTKSSIKSIAELPQVIPSDLTSGAVFGTSIDNVSWDCHYWLKDIKTFVVPTNVTFSAS